MHAHHIGETVAEQAVEHAHGIAEGGAERPALCGRKAGQHRDMAVGHDLHPVGILRIKGQKNGKVFILKNQPLLLLDFIFQLDAKQAAALLLIVLPGGGSLQLQLFRHIGVGVNLPVRVRHGYPNHVAPVFKRKHIFYLFIRAQRFKPLAPQVHQLFQVPVGKLLQRGGMAWGVKDDLTLAVRGAGLEKAGGNGVRLRRVLRQRRKIIVVFQHLIIRHLSKAGTKRAEILRHLRPALTVSRDHDPILQKRIPT